MICFRSNANIPESVGTIKMKKFYKDTSINLFFPKVNDYRKKYMDNEEGLKDRFQKGIILPVPEYADENIQRIIVSSKSGHSIIQISQVSASMTTSYDADFETNWDSCYEYLEERMSNLFFISGKLSDDHFFYSGIVTKIILVNDSTEDDLFEQAKKVMLSGTKIDPQHVKSGAYKLTNVLDNERYLNVSVSDFQERNIIRTNNGDKIVGNGPRGLQVVIDVNDRYKYNLLEDYKTDLRSGQENLKIMNNFIKNQMMDLITDGVF